MSGKLKKILRTAGIIYGVFVTVLLLLWWTSSYSRKTLVHLIVEGGINNSNKSTGKGILSEYINAAETLRTPAYESFSTEKVNLAMFERETLCNRKFQGYGNRFATLVDVVIDPTKGHGRRGGENISDVLNQNENSEYYSLEKGYFIIQCNETITYRFHGKTHVKRWFDALNTSHLRLKYNMPMKDWTIAVQRYEYANLYHTMTDYYNAFLVSKLFNMIPGNTTIIWIDGHPSGALDDTWSMLFGQVLRAGDLRKPVLFSNMVWGIMGYDSPLNQHRLHQVPYIEEFRTFFLSRYEIPVNRALYCGQLNITFLWRRDYLAHPRNPSGSVTRKIKNENELLTSAKTNFPADNIQGVQIDLLKMKDQLEVISTTDILIGMHGAGLSHTLFLPKHGGLIEIYPTYWSDSNIHFKAMAKWRQLKYRNWINRDGSKELSNHYTIVDTRAIIELLRQMRSTMCL